MARLSHVTQIGRDNMKLDKLAKLDIDHFCDGMGWWRNHDRSIDSPNDVTITSYIFTLIMKYKIRFNEVTGDFTISGFSKDHDYALQHLKDWAPKIVRGNANITYTTLKTLDGLTNTHIAGKLNCYGTNLSPEGLIGLIDLDVSEINYTKAVNSIINKYLKMKHKDKLAYQDELIDAGLI